MKLLISLTVGCVAAAVAYFLYYGAEPIGERMIDKISYFVIVVLDLGWSRGTMVASGLFGLLAAAATYVVLSRREKRAA